jgi:flagellar biosynthesis regulator FlaF
MQVKDILKKYDDAMAEKTVWDSIYQAVFRMTMPNRDSFYMDENIPNNWENTRLLTNVGAEAADIFAARFQRIICTDEQTSVTVKAPVYFEDTADQREIDAEITKSINMCIVPNLGNYLEAAYDLVAGTTVSYRTFSVAKRKFWRVPVPIKDVALSKAFTGETDGYYRKLKIKREEIPTVFPETEGRKLNGQTTTESNATEMIELKEATVYNYEDALWHYYVICGQELIVDRKTQVCDFSSSFWTRKPGSVYGIGVGVKALPELNQLNALRYYSTFGLMFRAAPMWLANENHMLDYDRLTMRPNEIIPVQNTGRDNPTLTPLTVGDDPNVAQWNQTQMEMNIKSVMLSDTIPNQTNKQMTATEIAERRNRLNVTNNNMVAVAQKMLEDDVRWLLYKFKDIPGFYPENFDVAAYADGVRITLASTEVKDTEQIQAIATMIDMFNAATPDGTLTQTALNQAKYANKLVQLLRVPEDLVLPEAQINANIEAKANAQANAEMQKQRAEMIREMLVNAAKNEQTAPGNNIV